MARIHITRTRNEIGHGLVDRILEGYEMATEHEVAAGLGWYEVANEIARDLTGDVITGAAILAALSPQVGWAPNVGAAVSLVGGEDPSSYGVLGANITKAERIWSGEPPSAVLGGRKVRSFYRNIALPSLHGPVTIDRHALNIALVGCGRVGADHRLLARKGGYALIAGAYRAAAREAWLVPNQLQAITWLTHRRLLDEQASGNLALAHIAQRSNLIGEQF